MTPSDALVAAARLLEAVGAAGLWGAPGLLRLAGTPGGRAPWSASLTGAAAAALAVGSVAALLGQTAAMAGSWREALGPDALGAVTTGTGFGRSVLVRLAAATLAAGLARRTRAAGGRTGVALLGGVALASLAWSGHGASDFGGDGGAARAWIHLGGDVAHLLAAGGWLGALAALLLLTAAARRSASPEATAAAARALRAFSGIGSTAVAVLAASGLLNAWFLIGAGGWTSLAADAWGRLLLLKLAAFAAMLALAALNRWRWTPALDRPAGDPGAGRALVRSVAAETSLGLLAVTAAAVMGGLMPPMPAMTSMGTG